MPPDVRIRVGNEVHEWVAGKCLIFDDSFEHEVRVRVRVRVRVK